MGALTTENELLWPTFHGPSDLAAVERVPLSERGLPASTYELVRRAAELWPDRPAVSVLPGRRVLPTRRSSGHSPSSPRDVHRAAAVLAELGVRRGDAVAVISVNCAEMLPLLLAAEAVGIYAPINPGLTAEHATELVRRSGAKVIVASGPELDHACVGTDARNRNQYRRASAARAPPHGSDRTTARARATRRHRGRVPRRADGQSRRRRLPVPPPPRRDIASYLHTGGTTGTPKLAARTHANEVSNAWMMRANDILDQDSVIFAALPLFHTNALVVTVLAPLLKGQHVVWGGPLGYRDAPLFPNFWKIVERYRIASMSGVPTIYAVLAQIPVDADISSLKLPVVGAAPLPPAVAMPSRRAPASRCARVMGSPRAPVPARSAGPTSAGRRRSGNAFPTSRRARWPSTRSTGDWTFLPEGEVGTLVLRGPNIFAGYLVEADSGLELRADGKVSGRLARHRRPRLR